MTLYDKIIKIYPTLTQADFMPTTGTIMLQNDSDGKGDYIKEWNHPTLAQPTQTQLDALNK
jgi:XkdW protein